MKLSLKQSIKVWFQVNIMSLFYFGYASKDQEKNNKFNREHQLALKSQGTAQNETNDATTTVIISANDDSEATINLITALKAQSTQGVNIWLTCQTNEQKAFYDHSDLVDAVWITNTNTLNWHKVALTLLVTTEYVVWIDDFMKPAKNWLDNCVNEFQKTPGIYGANGTMLTPQNSDTPFQSFGWDGIALNHNQAVHFVEHAVFFSKQIFTKIANELCAINNYHSTAEIMLCHLANKIQNVNCYVLPFNSNDESTLATDKNYSLPLSRQAQSFELLQARSATILSLRSQDVAVITPPQPTEITTSNRDFKEELYFFTDKILAHENFSIVRFGDGEMKIVKGEHIKTSRFYYTPGDEGHEHNRDVLCKSLSYDAPQYFVGFPGRCCVGDDYANSIIELSGLPDKQLTWASVFINANYDEFLSVTVPALQQRTLNLVCFEKSVLKHLPFPIKKRFNVGMNAWADDLETVLPAIEKYIEQGNIKNEVFIFCSGILSNMLIYKLTEKFPNNTYLDVGSVFDVYLSLGKTRRYLKGNQKQVQHSCIW